MSRSNPMHHDSNLHPIMQQALAPFAPKYPPLSKSQRAVLDNWDFNIRMFEGYGERHAARVEQMREARAALVRYFVGELDLAEALAAYGRGAALLKRAQSLLDEAAQTIELIDSQGSHSVVSRDQLESS
ncbi:MAG: hypothetical protein EBT14_08250 [Betaproteobacteria bacterium]|nr:hypothetical protein [Betaproteobacteria bacterium]